MKEAGFWNARVLPWLVEKACRSPLILQERKRWVPLARGAVLEVGVGSGLNLAFYDPSRVTSVRGVDPSPGLLQKARPRALASPVPVELVEGCAEALPAESASADSVVCTYTLCSVEAPLRALAELRRVLKPGGELLFVEHGLSQDPSVQRRQRALSPYWERLSGNCHLARDPRALLETAGFSLLECEASEAPEGLRVLAFTYQGRAVSEGSPRAS